MIDPYDVAIIGGGPAGSTAAALLAMRGRRVIVFEKEKFPRFHIGESLLPHSMRAFDRLGVRATMNARYMPKFGGEIATACGSKALSFLFEKGFRSTVQSAYQVERSDFDKMLLDHAAKAGAEVHEETAVEQMEFDEEGVTLEVQDAAGTREVRAKYLIDCSGRNAVVGQKFDLKVRYAHLQKFSVFAHYEHAQRDEGREGTLTRLIRAKSHWFWMIPIDDTRTSVGVVMDSADFKTRRQSPEETLAQLLDESALMRERMHDAVLVSPVRSAGDYSYRNTRLTGDRWLLAGDAAGFIDPIFSTGVFIAIHSGEQCADLLNATLDHPAKRAGLFRRYERKLNRLMDMYLRFVSAWYRDEFIDVFTNPTDKLQLAPAVNAVLAGNVGGSFAIWWRMQVFYLVLFLQRRLPLCPKATESAAMEKPELESAA
jgi:flavin-dependent dehydrogenase